MSVTLKSQTAGRQMAADIADAEAAKIGAAAERKRRQESSDSIGAILASDGKGGRAVYWQRRIRGADGENRESLEVERSGSYSPRAFLRLASKAAGQAGKGRWNRPEAVEAVAAELVVRTMAKTGGRMPMSGSLGRQCEGHENPDLAYLTSAARHLIASALRGEDAGLASEAAPIGNADQTAGDRSLADLMGEAGVASEGPRDPYLADPLTQGADLLNPDARKAAQSVAGLAAERPAAVLTAIVAAFRGPLAKSADLADAGYAASPDAARKAAQRGREALLRAIQRADDETRDAGDDTESGFMLAVTNLCDIEERERVPRPLMEGSPHTAYQRPKIEWPLVTEREDISPVTTYTATKPDWRTV